MKEVEILVGLSDKKNKVIEKLKDFCFCGCKKTLDIYFYKSTESGLKPNKDNTLNNVFRLRKKGDKAFITHKINHFHENGKWFYADEDEVEISDFNTGLQIIQHLGYEQLVRIDNEKSIFTNSKYEIVLEDVKDLGLFMEVERINVSCDENIHSVKNEIREFIKSFNLECNELHLGKPELALKKKNYFM